MITPSLLLFLVSSVLTLPVHYDITIIPEVSDLTFSGVTRVVYHVEEPVTTITLNAKNLIVTDVTFPSDDTVQVRTYGTDTETLVIELEGELTADGVYDIEITYNGKINENLEGFYVTKYVKLNEEAEEEERNFYLTDFQYYKARQVFPSEDVPTHYATYTLSIVRPNDYISVSNTAIQQSDEYDENRSIDIFTRTEPLPTHLLSFAIIDFPATPVESNIIYSLKPDVDFLGQVSIRVAQKFEETESFISNPITQIVVPDNSISRDVLENIGLIIYRESLVLYNEERQNTEDKQEIAKIVAHSIVSQRYKDFGRYEWWPNWWAVEGVTTLYQYQVLDEVEPTWRLLEQFVTEEISSALQYDVGENEISLVLTENDTPDIFTKYHTIKSFAFVRMFTHLFLPGDVLENPDNPIASSWVRNKGYPLLTATRNFEDNIMFTFAQGSLVVRQVPLNLVFASEDLTQERKFGLLLEKSSDQWNITNFVTDPWFLVNGNRLGYYRTNYGTRNWRSVTNFLLNSRNDISTIPAVDRAVLIEDAFHFAQERRLPFNFYLELVQFLKRDTDYIPVYAFIKTANQLKSQLSSQPSQAKFMRYAVSLVEHLYEHIGIDLSPTETHVNRIARAKVLTWLCAFGHTRCQQEMNEIITPQTAMPPDQQDIVYCGGMRFGTLLDLRFLAEEYYTHGTKRILKSMACTDRMGVLDYYARAIVDDSELLSLKEEDKVDAFLALLEGSDTGVNLALVISKQYLEHILESFSEDDISTMFIALSKKLVTEEQLALVDEIIACLNDEQKVTYGQLFETVKNNVEANSRWQNLHLEAIANWLDANVIELTTTTPTTTTTPEPTEAPEPPTTPAPDGAADIKISVFAVGLYAALHLVVVAVVRL